MGICFLHAGRCRLWDKDFAHFVRGCCFDTFPNAAIENLNELEAAVLRVWVLTEIDGSHLSAPQET